MFSLLMTGDSLLPDADRRRKWPHQSRSGQTSKKISGLIFDVQYLFVFLSTSDSLLAGQNVWELKLLPDFYSYNEMGQEYCASQPFLCVSII